MKIDANNIDFPYFKSVTFINDPNDGPAKSRRSTGELVINNFWWNKIKNNDHKMYVLWHEEGHIALNTIDEMLADEYASKKYFAHGFSELGSIQALTTMLDKKNPVHNARAWLQYQRALEHDYKVDKNQKSFLPHYDTISDVKQELRQGVFNK